jgi:hypothetical protein
MRFRLRTLLIVLALGPPIVAVAWFYGRLVEGLVIWACLLGAIPGLFALYYWMLLRSEAMSPETRGKPDYYGPSS